MLQYPALWVKLLGHLVLELHCCIHEPWHDCSMAVPPRYKATTTVRANNMRAAKSFGFFSRNNLLVKLAVKYCKPLATQFRLWCPVQKLFFSLDPCLSKRDLMGAEPWQQENHKDIKAFCRDIMCSVCPCICTHYLCLSILHIGMTR